MPLLVRLRIAAVPPESSEVWRVRLFRNLGRVWSRPRYVLMLWRGRWRLVLLWKSSVDCAQDRQARDAFSAVSFPPP